MNSGFEFLLNRGITEETIKQFGLSYFIDNKLYALPGDYPADFFNNIKNLVSNHIDKSSNIPHFNNSVIIPIFDLYNRLLSIQARRLVGTPKFEFLSYNKAAHCFGLNKSYPYILKKDHAYIVEGIFDFLIMWQYGVRNVVCPFGCSVSYEQMCLLARFAKSFTVVFDPDDAGKTGMFKVKDFFKKYGFNCTVLYLSEGLDLDEFILKYGMEVFLKNAKVTLTL